MSELLSETAKRLSAQSPEILRRWEARVLSDVPAAGTVELEVLRDHLHVLLEQVVAALAGASALPEAGRRLTVSEQHGGERALLETYSLGEVLQEYSILRQTVLEVLDEGLPMSLQEREIINDALEQALIGASTQYALVQQQAEHQLAEQARTEAAALLQADRHKNELLAWLAHEFRTPLFTISNALYILETLELEDPRAMRQIATAARQTRQMSRLVEDLLDLFRISRGALELRQERLDLRGPVVDAAEASMPLLDERSHRLDCSLPQEPLWVNGDPVRLIQVLTNLLGNAARYSPEGGLIQLSLEREGDQAVVRVEDNGIGIDPAMLPRIFDPFVQADSTSPQARKGLGIGLALSKKLVELHGGDLTVCSPGLGRGTDVSICLPLIHE